LNKVVIIGRLTKDAEFFQPENSTRGALKFILAVNRRFTSKNGEKEADFISVIHWSNYGDRIHSYLTKVRLIGVSGKIITRSYTSAEGIKKYVTEVEADSIQFLEGKKENWIQSAVGDM
jgi:single-strand DNA-binding protein